MATKHQLSLELPESNNIKVFRVFDTSIYAEGMTIDCGTLRITSPGFNLPVSIETLPSFNLVLSACSLGHRHPKVVNAIKKQLDSYMHVMVYGEYIQSPAVNLSKLLSDHLPKKLEKTYLINY